MENFFDISLSYHFSEDDKLLFSDSSIGDYKIKCGIVKNPEPNTGGPIWFGVVCFIAGAIATSFFSELTKDIYKAFKKKLFKVKKKIKKKKERFTINISIPNRNGMIFFELTNLNKKLFLKALDKIYLTLENKEIYNTDNWRFLTYDKKEKKWKIESDYDIY